MAVALLLIFCRFALVFTAHCLVLAVPLVRFSTCLVFSFFGVFSFCDGVNFGWVEGGVLGGRGGGRNNVLSLAFCLTPLF